MASKKKKTPAKTARQSRASKLIIENHKQAAEHYQEAAKHHLNAAAFYQSGDLHQAAHSTVLAYGHSAIAGEFVNDDAKHHAQQLKQTNYRH
ncbi:MAG: hypothetical protein ABWZ25_13400 [Chitinophagaceae bacterium]